MKQKKHLKPIKPILRVSGSSTPDSSIETQQETSEKTKALGRVETVRTINPTTGKEELIQIEVAEKKTPEQVDEDIKKDLKKFGLKPYEVVKTKDPFTGKEIIVNLDRTGHNERNLIQVLANPDLTRDRKDHELSMYMWQRGAESMSMMVDMMRYKGTYSRESQVFQSRMRLDFESFVNSFTRYLHQQSRLLGISLGVDIEKEKAAFTEWLKVGENSKKGYTYKDFYEIEHLGGEIDSSKMALIEMAIYAQDEADALVKAVENIVKARMAMKGGGIYVDKMGRPFSVNDPDLDEIIKKEREIEKEAGEDKAMG